MQQNLHKSRRHTSTPLILRSHFLESIHMLSEIAAIVQEELRRIPELRKRLSTLNLGLFSTDLVLVAHGIRYVCFCSNQHRHLKKSS